MPDAPRPKCRVAECLERSAKRSSYCIRHKPEFTNSKLPGYTCDPFINSRKWRAFSKQYLAGNPLCRACRGQGFARRATEVDHILPRSQGGENFELNNLQGLCKPCHARKTMLEQKSKLVHNA